LTYDTVWEPEEEDDDNDSLVDWTVTSSSEEEDVPDGILETGEYLCGYCE